LPQQCPTELYPSVSVKINDAFPFYSLCVAPKVGADKARTTKWQLEIGKPAERGIHGKKNHCGYVKAEKNRKKKVPA